MWICQWTLGLGLGVAAAVTSLTGAELDAVTAPPAAVRTALALPAFYTQHVDVGGFSVVSSAKVSDAALREAAFLIRQMVGQREDILRALAKNKVRFAVMAPTEFTTDIPEHSDLQPRLYWNRRARGLGASRQRPAVTCGEENLLGLPGDPYATENILIHEFAHAIHEMALSAIDPTFDRRLAEAFDAATKAGLWKDKYAGRNRMEYWAEGVQSWFDTNRENDFEHNHVNTRAELKQHDAALAKLVAEIFGDGPWRYTKPAARKPAPEHLRGVDPSKAPRFAFPAKEQAWYDRFKEGKETLAPDNAVEVDLLSPESTNWRSPQTPHRTTLHLLNASKQTVRVEWIDFKGQPSLRGTLRPTDHLEQGTFAGHVWRLSDDKAGKVLHYFITPLRPGKLVIRD